MGIRELSFILVAVASLLASTLADVLVQPGYGQPGGQTQKNFADQSSSSSSSSSGNSNGNALKNQPVGNSQQNYKQQSQNPVLQALRQQHLLEQHYLQQRHQQEHNHLLQHQKQQLQNSVQPQPAGNQASADQVVGTPWGLGSLLGPLPNHGKIFSLGPLGLQSLGYGNGLAGLLMSPFDSSYMTGSSQYGDGASQTRSRRDVGDSKESAGKKSRQKSSRPKQDDVAANPALNPKSDDSVQPEAQPSKRYGNYNDESIGSGAGGLLDPFNLLAETEGLIDGLKSGHLPGTLDVFKHGGSPFALGSVKSHQNSGVPQIKEHIVSQPHQNPSSYDVTNDQFKNQQSQDPILESPRFKLQSMMNRPPTISMPYGTAYGYGMYPPAAAYSPYRPRYRNTMSPYGTSYPAYQTIGYPQSDGQSYQLYNPIMGSPNPATSSAAVDPSTGRTHPMTAGKDASGYSLGNDPLTGSSSPTQQYSPGIYDESNALEPMTGSAVKSAWDGGPIPLKPEHGEAGAEGQAAEGSGILGISPFENFNHPSNQWSNGYGSQRHGYELEDILEPGYDHHHHHHGGYDRIYDTNFYDDNLYGYGSDGGYPYHTHHHVQSYIL